MTISSELNNKDACCGEISPDRDCNFQATMNSTRKNEIFTQKPEKAHKLKHSSEIFFSRFGPSGQPKMGTKKKQ